MSPILEIRATPDQQVDFALAALFRGVALSDAEREGAEAVIRADVLARSEPPAPGEDGWERDLRSMVERNVKLRALLATEAQRVAFDANATAQRQLLEEVRRGAVLREPDAPSRAG
ncbi:hypothetical protein J421_5367 (plasmid) [Gemmatirosa kalamazoonensis]|uniref:Uncharacterized protein n=1 Tax=Gemmatirosa kalamazoonensis TaxID=861299 RepID=W0RR09_9BACT|nr:hypothetical protein [Gemmatirosa kalamazoonensis]AHG92878.1 hypothetical protein J421_5343 [Gemmatirosa kalamazoonensis]AHG92902.1 hypothetical protein J421_5367 [Gemmatirosa kalamazoonensis]